MRPTVHTELAPSCRSFGCPRPTLVGQGCGLSLNSWAVRQGFLHLIRDPIATNSLSSFPAFGDCFKLIRAATEQQEDTYLLGAPAAMQGTLVRSQGLLPWISTASGQLILQASASMSTGAGSSSSSSGSSNSAHAATSRSSSTGSGPSSLSSPGSTAQVRSGPQAAAAAAASPGAGTHPLTDQGGQQHEQQQQLTAEQRGLLQQLLRDAMLAEAAMTSVLRGQQVVLCDRPDAAALHLQELQVLQEVQELLPRYHTRPPLLASLAKAIGFSLGAAATAAPQGLQYAVLGALQDALTERYNEQLMALRGAGLSEEVPEVRALLLHLRDLQRAPEGAPDPPDLLALQKMESLKDLGVEGVVAGAVKAGVQAALELTHKLKL